MGRKKQMTTVESTPVVSESLVPVFAFDEESKAKRYSVKLADGTESKTVLPELSKTQEETIELNDISYVVSYNEENNEWIGEGIVLSPSKGQGPKEEFSKGPFSTWYPNGYVVGKHRTLQRIDFADPWDYRLFRVKALMEFEKQRAEHKYREALASIDDDFSEDIRVVKELENLSKDERDKKLAEVVKQAKKSASDKSFVKALTSGGADRLKDLLGQCALSDEDKAKLRETLAAALAAM